MNNFKRSLFVTSFLVGAAIGLSPAVQADVLDGVTMGDKIKVDGNSLVLNGMGTRKATIFKVKVYVAGLYVQTPSQNSEELLASNQIKRVEMHFVHDVPATKLVSGWNESFEKNCKTNCEEMKPALAKLTALMLDIQKGDKLSFTFFPKYVDVSIKNQAPTRIENTEYGRLLLQSWIGQNPPNQDLKDGLLGLKKS